MPDDDNGDSPKHYHDGQIGQSWPTSDPYSYEDTFDLHCVSKKFPPLNAL